MKNEKALFGTIIRERDAPTEISVLAPVIGSVYEEKGKSLCAFFNKTA